MKENTEQDWVERAKQGEPAAVAELYRHYWRAARATAYGVTGDLEMAEDAASEAFYSALDGLQDLRDTQRFGPWLHAIVVRTAKHYKNAKPKEENGAELQTLPDAQSLAPSATLEQQELTLLIHEAVGNLPETLRETMSLFYFEGYSVEEASRFLDIPAGTLKRRLHDGRGHLRDMAEQILKGKKPTNIQREQILQQIRDFMDKRPDTEEFHRVIHQALRLRPLPYDLLGKLMQRHSRIAKKITTSEGREETVCKARRMFDHLYQPSQRAVDPEHVVGKVARAIRATMPEFQEWQVDASKAARNLVQRISGDYTACNLPPGFADGTPGAYLYMSRGCLFQSQDGSMHTMYEFAQDENTEKINDVLIHSCRMSDTLVLMWMQTGTLELRAIEERLRGLSRIIAPQIPARFLPYEEPRYRSALRMQLGDIIIPAAIGGLLNPWPYMPNGVSLACVQIFLEPWATAQSGQVIELTDFP